MVSMSRIHASSSIRAVYGTVPSQSGLFHSRQVQYDRDKCQEKMHT